MLKNLLSLILLVSNPPSVGLTKSVALVLPTALPLPVATTFEFRDENGESLADVAYIDNMITVVDAVNLLNDYSSHDFLTDRGESLGDEDNRTLVHLLTDQIEFADVIILNKTDIVAPDQLEIVRKLVRSLNPDAEIVESEFGILLLKT